MTVPPEDVGNLNEPRRLDAFLISYRDQEPERARRVTDTLVSVFIEENAKSRTDRAEGTAEFIAEQLKATQARLVTLEAQLRVAKESHMGALPEQTAANLSTLSGLRQQLESNATTLRGEIDRLSMVERELQALKVGAGRRDQTLAHAGPAPDSSGGRGSCSCSAPSKTRASLTRPNTLRYSASRSTSPPQRKSRLIRVRRTIAWPSCRFDPGYRQAVADRESTRLRIRDLQRSQVDLERQIREYQVRVESAPRVEQQLAVMVRDYDLGAAAVCRAVIEAARGQHCRERRAQGGRRPVHNPLPGQAPTAPTSPCPSGDVDDRGGRPDHRSRRHHRARGIRPVGPRRSRSQGRSSSCRSWARSAGFVCDRRATL